MPTWKGIIGAAFTPAEFDQYCHRLHWLAWRPSFVVLHNTGEPTLAQRPRGLTRPHIAGLERFYRDTQRWSAGPHLFIDDRQIWVFTALTESGVHSPSWNKLALGVEMLGDYQTEAFDTGRGALVQAHTVAALATLSGVLGLDPATLRLHKEDPLTTHKSCPGAHVHQAAVVAAVQARVLARHGGEHPAPPAL